MASDGARLKVVVARRLGPEAMAILQERPELELVIWPEDRICDRKWLLDNVPGAVGITVMLTDKVDVELLDRAGPSLRVISTTSVGYEHVDIPAITQRGIKLGYTPDVLTDAVADLTVMLTLMAGRNAGEAIPVVQNGEWPRLPWSLSAFCGPQLSTTPFTPTRTIGFLGFGRIAQATLARLVPFGITHAIFTTNPSTQPDPAAEAALAEKFRLRSVRRVSMDELAAKSDVLIVLAPGGARTRHVVDEALLRKMKKTSVLVNTGRGTTVDSDALAKALREKWIWGAGLDVVEGEPGITKDHPLVGEPRCVIVPHIGSATLETRLGMSTLTAKNLVAGLFGETMPAEFKP